MCIYIYICVCVCGIIEIQQQTFKCLAVSLWNVFLRRLKVERWNHSWLSSKYLPVQSKHDRHHSDLFTVNFERISQFFFKVPIADFEQIIVFSYNLYIMLFVVSYIDFPSWLNQKTRGKMKDWQCWKRRNLRALLNSDKFTIKFFRRYNHQDLCRLYTRWGTFFWLCCEVTDFHLAKFLKWSSVYVNCCSVTRSYQATMLPELPLKTCVILFF